MRNIIEYFELSKRATTFRKEVIAGCSTYSSLAYIFVVNPAILSVSGMDPSAIFFATVVVSGVATIAMGLWANLPFAVAPGLELNGFFSFVVVGSMGLSWQEALGVVFWSGVLCVIFTVLPVRRKLIDEIPPSLRLNIAMTVGVFVFLIGLYVGGLLDFRNGRPDFYSWTAHKLFSPECIVLFVSTTFCFAFGRRGRRTPVAIIFSIIVGTLLATFFDIKPPSLAPITLSTILSALGQLKFIPENFNTSFFSAILVFFIVDFFGGIGKFIGLSSGTSIQVDGQVPRLGRALYVDSAGTVAGSLVGTSSLIVFVESAIGIAAGGRTGLTAITCGILMLSSLMFLPTLGTIPLVATSGVLVYVGWLLLPHLNQFFSKVQSTRLDIICTVAMAVTTFLTFSLDKPLLIGLLFHIFTSIRSGTRPSWSVLTMAASLSAVISFQMIRA